MPFRPRALLILLLGLAACARTPQTAPPAVEPAAGPSTQRDCRHLAASPEAAPAALLVETFGPIELAPAPPAAASSGEARCRLLLGAPAISQQRLSPRGVVRLEGERPVATRRRVNPEYRRLEAELRRLEREERAPTRLSRTGDPALDLLGLLLGGAVDLVRAAAGSNEREALAARLAATPRYLEEPVTSRYTYEVELFELYRRGTVEAVLWDASSGRTWRARLPFEERRTLALPLGRDPRDRRTPAGFTLVADRRALEDPTALPIRLDPGALFSTLATALEETGRTRDLAALRTQLAAASTLPAAGPPPAATPADGNGGIDPAELPLRPHEAVVVVLAGDEPRALGFYVAPQRVLTVAHALPPGSLVPLETSSGLRLYGLVERRDPRADLALLWVPRRARPLGWARGDVPEPLVLLVPRRDIRLRTGAPVAVGGGVLALVRDDRIRPWPLVAADRLARFSAPAALAATP